MFGRGVSEKIQELTDRHDLLENTVMINLPRIYKIEQQMNNVLQRMDSCDMHVGRLVEKEKGTRQLYAGN